MNNDLQYLLTLQDSDVNICNVDNNRVQYITYDHNLPVIVNQIVTIIKQDFNSIYGT